jgi:hypothetical protein
MKSGEVLEDDGMVNALLPRAIRIAAAIGRCRRTMMGYVLWSISAERKVIEEFG